MTVCLPFEIIIVIFENISDVRDLRNVRTASRTLCAAATPIAFRFLSVNSTAGSARNLGRIFDVPDIAAHVREVSYLDTGDNRQGRTQTLGGGSFSCYPILHILYNLTTCLCVSAVVDHVSQKFRHPQTVQFLFPHSPITPARDHQFDVLPIRYTRV